MTLPTTESELIALALRHAADSTEPERPSVAYAAVAAGVALKLESMGELERLRLLRQHATDPARLVDLNRLARAAGWPVVEEVHA